MNIMKSFSALPDTITSVIKCIGQVESGDRYYIPNIARRQKNRGQFFPLANNTTYQNLRETVEMLANAHGHQRYRELCYENSPLPGAVWDTEGH